MYSPSSSRSSSSFHSSHSQCSVPPPVVEAHPIAIDNSMSIPVMVVYNIVNPDGTITVSPPTILHQQAAAFAAPVIANQVPVYPGSTPLHAVSSHPIQHHIFSAPSLASSPTSVTHLRHAHHCMSAPPNLQWSSVSSDTSVTTDSFSSSSSRQSLESVNSKNRAIILPGNRHDCAICQKALLSKNVCRLLCHPVGASSLEAVCSHHFHTECVKALPQPWCCPLCVLPFTHIQPVESFAPFDTTAADKWFRLLDTDNDGKLSYDDVVNGLKFQFKMDWRQIELDVHQLWRRFDSDNDGVITLTEFVKPVDGLYHYINNNFGPSPRSPPPDIRVNKIAWFRYFDESRCGSLSKFDIINALVQQFRHRHLEFAVVARYVDALWPAFDPRDVGRIEIMDFVMKNGLGDAIIGQLIENGLYHAAATN